MPTTILVIDDARNIRTLVAGYLEGEGYRVLTASNGGRAWKSSAPTRPI